MYAARTPSCSGKNRELADRKNVHERHVPRRHRKIEARNRHGQLETPGAGAPWVDVKNPRSFGAARLVRMAAYYDLNPSRCWIQIQLLKIVEHIDGRRASLYDRGGG